VAKTYFGKVCAKHPELKGERRRDSYNCVACDRERFRKYHEENREAALACRRKRHEENREAIAAYKRKYREENREAIAAYRRKYYEENREARLACCRKWHEENREARLAYQRKRDEEFKAKHGIASRTHYSRLKKQKEAQQCSV
jgi:hypothetical protein